MKRPIITADQVRSRPGARSGSVTKLAVSGQPIMTARGQIARLNGGGAVSSKPPYPPRRLTELGALAFHDRVGSARGCPVSACRLTCVFAVCLERGFPLCGFADVVAGCGAAVARPRRPAGAGLAGFWRTGRAGEGRVDVPKSPADPGRGEPSRQGGAFPGQAEVFGQGPGEPELGVAGDGQPGPPVGGGGVADLGGGPAEDLLEQAEGVFKIKPAEECLP